MLIIRLTAPVRPARLVFLQIGLRVAYDVRPIAKQSQTLVALRTEQSPDFAGAMVVVDAQRARLLAAADCTAISLASQLGLVVVNRDSEFLA
jgi:hypothetical protein